MYLLDQESDGQLRLTDFDRNNTPHYAILSHTWEQDEVSFKDVVKRRYAGKNGYRKIQFCLKQAEADGLRYCWVDTCCIDKKNFTELSEAINSMFRWYKNADICYVYLSDVPAEAFRSSRWFTRGWTLQELLAPLNVVFFSSTGERLGDKKSLMQDIHEETQIPTAALQGGSLAQFSIDERMSWIARRNTKLEEDMAYSLLGIFGIFLPLIYGEGRESAELRLRGRITDSRELRMSTARQDFILPFALPGAPIITSFIGRANEISQIREALPLSGRRETVILHGLGGMGKTQLAIEYAKMRQAEYTAVLWMDGRDEVTLQQSFATAAGRLSDAHPSLSALKIAAESTNLIDAADAVLRWLNVADNGRWLLAIDNVDAPYIAGVVEGLYDVRRYLPTTLHGHVLITTRSSQLRIGRQIKLHKVGDGQECLRILQAVSQRPDIESDTKALELVRRLDGLPLALSTAGAYLSQVAISPSEYLELYEHSWQELQQSLPGLPEHQGRTLQTTWEMSRRQVEARNPNACRLLELWAYLASQDVWYELLQAGKTDAPEWFVTVTKSKISFDYHMRILCDHGLVEAQREPPGYGMHSCVHDWVREILSKSDRDQDARKEESDLALRCISLAVPSKMETEYWIPQRRLLSHADSWLKQSESRGQSDQQIEYISDLGDLYSEQGRSADAEAMYNWALESQEKALGREHISTLETVNCLGILYANQGKLAEAEALYMRALEGKEKALGRDHTSTLATVNNLGALYDDQGKLKEAEEMYTRALDGYKEALGREHAYTLNTVNNIGLLYEQQGKLTEAEAMYRWALEGKEKSLGLEHTYTLNTVHNFGLLYAKQGKLAEAEAMFQRALDGCEKVLGSEHMSTIDTVDDLGVLYVRQGRLAEAEAMYIRALEGKEKLLGRDRLSTLSTVHKLGILYEEQNRLAEAEAMYKWMLEVYERVSGVDDESTLRTAEKLRSLRVGSSLAHQDTSEKPVSDDNRPPDQSNNI